MEPAFTRSQLKNHVVTPALLGKVDPRVDWLVPNGSLCQQPQNQDESQAAEQHPGKNELSDSEVTLGKELLRHLVVEQLAMTGTR